MGTQVNRVGPFPYNCRQLLRTSTAKIEGWEMASRGSAMTSDAEIDLMARRASIWLGRGLWTVIVLAPCHHVIPGFHDLMTFIAGVASISRNHSVAASARGGRTIRIRRVVTPKRLCVICWPFGSWHMRAWSKGANS